MRSISDLSRTRQIGIGRFACLAFFLSVGVSGPMVTLAFQIVEPNEGAALTSGQTLTVRVDPGQDTGIVKVRYYWYGEEEEVLVEQEASRAVGAIVKTATLTATSDTTPPFGGPLGVPQTAIGMMRILAVAEVSRGRLGSRSIFDEILVDVKPNAKLVSIEFGIDTMRFGSAGKEHVYASIDSLGKMAVIPINGTFSDGVVRPIRLPATGTTYRSSDENIVKVFPNGMLQVMGNGRTFITASNSGKEGILPVSIQVPDEPNEPPEGDAGPDRTVKSGSRVVLNGGNSLDPEGGSLQYHWSQTRGAKISLLDNNMRKASFQAPDVSEPKTYRFRLRVTDTRNADSMPDYVDIVVEP